MPPMPKSVILGWISPFDRWTRMLAGLRSRWTIGGSSRCAKATISAICDSAPATCSGVGLSAWRCQSRISPPRSPPSTYSYCKHGGSALEKGRVQPDDAGMPALPHHPVQYLGLVPQEHVAGPGSQCRTSTPPGPGEAKWALRAFQTSPNPPMPSNSLRTQSPTPGGRSPGRNCGCRSGSGMKGIRSSGRSRANPGQTDRPPGPKAASAIGGPGRGIA